MTDDPADDATRLAAMETRLAEVQADASARVLRAELKTAALRAGMIDLDGIRLIDTVGLTLNEAGEVEGVGPLMRELKQRKPWLFGAASSSSTATAPQPSPPRAKQATEMSADEWQAARAELLRRR